MSPLIALRLPPGTYRIGTAYDAKGRWYDAQYIRFVGNSPRPIGAWQALTTSGSPSGYARTLLAWRNNAGTPQLAVGTNTKAYVFIEGTLTDITLAGTTTGNQSASYATGLYGAGNYGAGNYGGGDSTQSTLVPGATWQFDAFGQLLLGVLSSDGRLLWWNANVANDFAVVTASTGSTPTGNIGVVVTNERFAFVLGAGGDARAIQWPSQETPTAAGAADWTATATNTAGDFLLPGSGKIVCGRRARNGTLIFTDQDLFIAQYIGGTLVYRFDQVGSGCGIIGPNAVAMVDGRAEWMGHNGFYQFDGYVKSIPCDVQDYVFQNLNRTQAFKCFAVAQPDFQEVWYFFPSSDGTQADEPERYVIHNYAEGHWTIGRELMRSAAFERGVFDYPFMVSPGSSSTIYEHERGSLDTGGAFAESGPIELGDGERVMELTSLIPDQSGPNGQVLEGLQATLYTALYPTGTETTLGPYDLANPTSLRGTGRQVRLRVGAPNALFIAVGGQTVPLFYTSPDGSTWTLQHTGLPAAFGLGIDVRVDNGQITALTYDGSGNTRILTSEDGVAWDLKPVLTDSVSVSLGYGNGLWIQAGWFYSQSNARIRVSRDRETWTYNAAGFTAGTETVLEIAYLNGAWYAGGSAGTLTYSVDAVNWTVLTSGFGVNGIRAIAYGNGVYVIAGDAGTLASSTNGTTWILRTSGFGASIIQEVTYGNGVFVAVGAAGKIFTSPTGVTWTARTSGFGASDCVGVTWKNGKFVVVGAAGKVATSLDGTTWTLQTSGASETLFAVSALGSTNAAVDWRLGVPRLEVRPGSRR